MGNLAAAVAIPGDRDRGDPPELGSRPPWSAATTRQGVVNRRRTSFHLQWCRSRSTRISRHCPADAGEGDWLVRWSQRDVTIASTAGPLPDT
jgi:hypothetical protein